MDWPKLTEGPLTAHQIEQYERATARGNLAILGGSPGTGKTFTAAQIIKAIGNQIGFTSIGVGAPTGKAAVRLTEAMAAYRLPLRASTWHSLLKVEQADDGGGWSFAHNAGNPLPFTFLVGDESSMLDTDLAASIFSARARGTKFLCIGDVNQLPPVGHGAPLRDMIAAGLPYGELREIKRNEGGIVQACADIRDGLPFTCEGNLRLVEAWSPGEQQDQMLETINEASPRVRRRSDLGRASAGRGQQGGRAEPSEGKQDPAEHAQPEPRSQRDAVSLERQGHQHEERILPAGRETAAHGGLQL
jgi:hypothetical protein